MVFLEYGTKCFIARVFSNLHGLYKNIGLVSMFRNAIWELPIWMAFIGILMIQNSDILHRKEELFQSMMLGLYDRQ